MSCIDVSFPPIPSIPAILLPNTSFIATITIGTVGVTCCTYTIPGQPIPIPFPPIPGTVLLPVIKAMNVLIKAGLVVLDQIHIPSCALNGSP